MNVVICFWRFPFFGKEEHRKSFIRDRSVIIYSSIADMSHATSTKLLSQLKTLAQRSLQSSYNKLAVQELLERAFTDKKPLFISTDLPQAAALMEKAIPIFERAFADIHGSMNPDLRQSAQIWRSGLQFLVDEFKVDEIHYKKFEQILKSDPVECVEEFIYNSRETPPEYGFDMNIDQTTIPKEHTWWS